MDGLIWFVCGLIVGGFVTLLIVAAYIAGAEQDLGNK